MASRLATTTARSSLIFRVLADLVVVLHIGFVLFVVLGGFLVRRWPRLIYVHVPVAVYGVLIELVGWVCPLTPLENHLRSLGGEAGYSGGFVEHYLLPILYPNALTRNVQLLLALFVVACNAVAYGLVIRARRARKKKLSGAAASDAKDSTP
jgi:hypothetical protein